MTTVLHTGLEMIVVGVGTLGVSCRQGRAWYRDVLPREREREREREKERDRYSQSRLLLEREDIRLRVATIVVAGGTQNLGHEECLPPPFKFSFVARPVCKTVAVTAMAGKQHLGVEQIFATGRATRAVQLSKVL